MKNKSKLLVFDFDGTALGGHVPYDMFPKPFVRFLDGLGRKHILWATNTTWGPEVQFNVIKRSKLTSRPVFLTGATGLMMATIRQGRLLIDRHHARAMIRTEQRFREKNHPVIRRVFIQLLKSGLLEHFSSYNFDFAQNMIMLECKKRHVGRVWRRLAPLLKSGAYYSWGAEPEGKRIVLFPEFMNKGAVVKVMQKRLGIGPEDTIVAGDGSNDLPMFNPQVAKWAVCPANADPLVKRAVRQMDGVIAGRPFSQGVIEGVKSILKKIAGYNHG